MKRAQHTAPLLDYAAARSAGEVAASACLDAAERRGFDTESAREFVLSFLRTYGEASGEQLVLAARASGLVPHDDRAFGPVFGTLVRRELIQCVRFVPRKRGHGTAGGRVWRAA